MRPISIKSVSLLLAFICGLTVSQSQAAITVPQGYKAEVIASGLGYPVCVKANKNDELFVVESSKHRISKITPDGTVSVFAKSGPGAPLNYGPGFRAKIDFDAAGNLYTAVVGWYDDPYNPYGDVLDTVYKITPDGTVSAVARHWFSPNVFFDISGLTIGPDGYLYIGDTWTPHDILKVDLATKTSVRIPDVYYPIDLLFDKQGNLLVASSTGYGYGWKIWMITPDGSKSVYFDSFEAPFSLAWGPDGLLYMLDIWRNKIFTLDPATKAVKTFAYGFYGAYDIDFDSKGNLYVVEGLDDWNACRTFSKCLGKVTKISKEDPAFKNVRLIDTIPAKDVEFALSSATKTPYSVSTSGDLTTVEWRFDSIKVDQNETISFDLNLFNLAPGENRLVDHKLELIYTDKNGKEIKVALPPLYINVLNSVFDSSITTDKAAYQANETVSITPAITNLSGYARTIDAKILIEDSMGGLVKEAATFQSLTFNAGESKSFGQVAFNIGTNLAGDYKARLILYEGQKQVGEAFANFKIQPTMTLNSKVSTDKTAYNPNEQVAIASTVQSTSPNYIFENLTAKITITDSQGTSLFTDTKAIPILTQGQITELKTYWNTAANAAGKYIATLTVQSSTGETLSTSQTFFEILSTAFTGAGLKGTLKANPTPVYQGRDETFTYTITNNGNADLNGVPLKILIVDPDTGEIKTTLSATSNISKGGTIVVNLATSTLNLTPKIYLAILQSEVGGNIKTLASTTFEVLPALEIKQTIPDYGRILVWINDKCEKDSKQDAESSKQKEKQKTEDRRQNTEEDDDDKDEEHKQCVRQGLVEKALIEIGVTYHIVKDKKDFEKELRNNYYTDYLILGDHNPLEDHYGEELRERVFSGKGLITSPWIGEDEDDELFDIEVEGKLKEKDNAIEFTESAIFKTQAFISSGRAVKIDEYNPANVLAWIDKDGEQLTVNSERKDKEHNNKESEEIRAKKYPAVIKNEYGNGKALFFAFDLGLSIREDNYTQFVEILRSSLNYVHRPIDITAFHPYDLAPIRIELKSLGAEFDLKITETYPDEIKLIDQSAGQWITDNPWTKELHLAANETEAINLIALTPDARGRYTLTTDISYLENSSWKPYQTLSTEIAVEKDAHTLINDILYKLDTLYPATNKEREEVEEAKREIEKIRDRAINTKEDLDKNIHDLLEAIEAIMEITSVDTQDVRLDMDRLLGIYGERWYMGR